MRAWIFLSLLILILGLTAFALILIKYREKLLGGFSQKIWMTLLLGLTFAGLFFLGNGLLAYWFKSHLIVPDLALYASNVSFLIRIGLTFFLLNSLLILAFRSLIKVLYRIKS